MSYFVFLYSKQKLTPFLDSCKKKKKKKLKKENQVGIRVFAFLYHHDIKKENSKRGEKRLYMFIRDICW